MKKLVLLFVCMFLCVNTAFAKGNNIDINYDNGIYHTLVMYDKDHVPMIRYTIMKGCPHTYTGEMAQLTWDTFLCHFTREADGSIQYHG